MPYFLLSTIEEDNTAQVCYLAKLLLASNYVHDFYSPTKLYYLHYF